jgi:hypothetical protein
VSQVFVIRGHVRIICGRSEFIIIPIIIIRVPLRDVSLVYCSYKTCSCAKCASDANTVCKDTDIFRKQLVVTVNDTLL